MIVGSWDTNQGRGTRTKAGDYLHYNPVEAGFVSRTTDWKYSSAVDYNGGKGLIEIMHLDPMIIYRV